MPVHFQLSCNHVKTSTLTAFVKKQKCPGNELATKICWFQYCTNLVWKVSSFIPQVAFCFLTLQKINKKECRERGKELRFIAYRINLEKRTIILLFTCAWVHNLVGSKSKTEKTLIFTKIYYVFFTEWAPRIARKALLEGLGGKILLYICKTTYLELNVSCNQSSTK